ncbi:MAG TPA: glycosyltransferase family 2 protein [Castellaniella sp.]|uniref:glycosyltransferase family 2 protein n=1 Tax=Castellaniella sp. TaxID=1955812 RepID=UPI002F08D61D
MNIPVLLLIFNRPDTTQAVFDVIRAAKPTRLYVACDGARQGRPEESLAVEYTRTLATAVDWECRVYTLFRDRNLGCRLAVSGALDWFFDQEERGIVLEDDCVVDASFFPFVSELLTRYADDERVMAISAMHAHGNAHRPNTSYFFSRYNHCWGWASWRRAWRMYDHDMDLWPSLRETDWLLRLGSGNRLFSRYWTNIFDRAHAGQIDSWAYRWTFTCWAQHGLSVLPAYNLVKNIGFGIGATHTTDVKSPLGSLKLESLEFPLVHPSGMVRDARADIWTDDNIFGIRRINALKEALRVLPGGEILASIYRGMKGS